MKAWIVSGLLWAGLVIMATPAWAGGGYYLMLPPLTLNLEFPPAKIPLASWERWETTARECRAYRGLSLIAVEERITLRLNDVEEAERRSKAEVGFRWSGRLAARRDGLEALYRHRQRASLCITTNDPTLTPRGGK
jgi:hypothetical protein